MSKLARHCLPLLCLLAILPAQAQPPQAAAREAAPWDPSGYWVSLVTEDWRFRMLAAPAGDYPGIALTPRGQAIAQAWDPAADAAAGELCKAYGAGGIMRMPTRLNIHWQGDDVLAIETDAGRQTRLLKFGAAQDEDGAGTLQGVSRASWQLERAGNFRTPVINGSLHVVT